MDKILIVDNNETNIDLISKFLDTNNSKIYTALSGKSALAKIKMFVPDLILLNSDFKDMSGFDVCKSTKSDAVTKYCLVLLMLEAETKDYVLRSLHSGADDYIPKNFDSTVLISKVNSLLRVKHLGDRITLQYKELKEKTELLDFQLKTARKVQRAIIRDINSKMGELEIKSRYLPALEIGGDFFDTKMLDSNRIGIVLGDVSGHGISAALLTSMLGMMFNTLVYQYDEPNRLLNAMNQQFYDIFEGSDTQMYACVFYAIVDIKEKTVLYSNAGQSFPIFVEPKKESAVELQLGGVPVGMLQDVVYSNNKIKYTNGDYLFFNTDGLSDFYFKDNPMEFTERLKSTLLTYTKDKNKSLDNIIDIVLEQFYTYDERKKYSADDVSIIMCKL